MRLTKEITLGDRAFTAKELTVADIRAWLKDLEAVDAEFDLVGSALVEGVALSDLSRMTSATREDIEALTPSQIRELFDAARGVNADFFTLRARLEAIGQAALANSAES